MAEDSGLPPLPLHASSKEKAERYGELVEQIVAVLDGETDLIARQATVVAMLSAAFESYFWTGFYLVDPREPGELVIGPYQGTLGCLRIAFGRGVCGLAASTRQTQIVEDVHAFPGHIACDSRSNSEIVAPVFHPDGTLMGVLDVDSTELSAFDTVDAAGLEAILSRVFAQAG